jgi:N-acetylglutamate synthase-like GNAT family acetyltransferase
VRKDKKGNLTVIVMQIEYRYDKEIPSEKLIELYQASKYNDWWSEVNVKAMINHRYIVLTAWDGDRLVGTVNVISDGVNLALLDDLVVHPDYRRQGIGSTLIRSVLDRLNQLNLDFIQLIPIPGKEPFFEKCGFKIVENHQVMGYE